eukprot:TRINITY_DN22823_c0_g1_i2.p1 TRINITY_DN22823_c0_g1~~TRINITY_DN22823_c0_g1_i2.p1  ORF type:complete len:665 (+),score=173.55 TRINITY_DN22823_c0_g1_i2:93-2087(+)
MDAQEEESAGGAAAADGSDELSRVQQELAAWRARRKETSTGERKAPREPDAGAERTDAVSSVLRAHHLTCIGGGCDAPLLQHVVSRAKIVAARRGAGLRPLALAPAAGAAFLPAEEAARGAGGHPRGGRCVLRHRASGLRVAISPGSGALRLSAERPPAAFRFDGRRLVHDASGQAVCTAAGGGGAERAVVLAENGAAAGRWVRSAPQGVLWEATSGAVLRPAAAEDGAELVAVHSLTGSLAWDLEGIGDRAEACGAEDGPGDPALRELISGMQTEAAWREEQEWTLQGDAAPSDPGILLSGLPAEAFTAPSTADAVAAAGAPGGSDTHGGHLVDEDWFCVAPSVPEDGSGGARTALVPPASVAGRKDAVARPPEPASPPRTDKPPLGLITEVFEKHANYQEKEHCIEHVQRNRCAGCGNALVKEYSVLHAARRYDSVRFCFYTGEYHCPSCQDPEDLDTMPIPGRMLHNWDFRQRPVSLRAVRYLRGAYYRPEVCISAVAPLLFESVTALRIARQVRVQMAILHPVLEGCSLWAAHVRRQPEAMPRGEEYYARDSELWSLQDLAVFHQHQPALGRDDSGTGAEVLHSHPLVSRLKIMRAHMIKHVVTGCPQRCYVRAAHTCEQCSNSEVIFAFDINNMQTCPRCGRVYHKICYRLQPCRHCFA